MWVKRCAFNPTQPKSRAKRKKAHEMIHLSRARTLDNEICKVTAQILIVAKSVVEVHDVDSLHE